MQIPAIKQAKKMGLHVITFDYDSNAPGFKLSDEAYEISTIDISSSVLKAKQIKPDGVMTLASDMPMRTVAAIAKELRLQSISEEIAYIATNKARMREKFREYNVPSPEFYVVTDISMFYEVVTKFKDKQFIVKPADNSGSRGIHHCKFNEDLESVFEYSKSFSRSGEILVEEYMEGQEVSVETFSIRGIVNVVAITDKITTGPPYFVEMGHTQPSKLSIDIQEKICEVAIAAVKALGINNGPSHVEVMVTKDGPKVVELGARLGGDNISTHLVPLSTGINLIETSIELALGYSPNIKKKFNKVVSIRYLKCTTGKITSITGAKDVCNIRGVKEFKLLKNIGDTVPELQNSNARIGYVICTGESIDDVNNQCDKAVSTIKIMVE